MPRKKHPVRRWDEPIEVDQRFREFVMKLDGEVENDENDRNEWKETKTFFHRRRYAEEFRNTQFPWPGASDIVMPLIDKKIDELKPLYLNMVLAQKPPITALAVTEEAQQKSQNVELWFDWLINHGGSPHFSDELSLWVDDIISHGVGVAKTFWQYETIRMPEVIDARRLPPDIRQLLVAPSDEAADQAFFATGRPTISKRELRSVKPQLAKLVAQHFDLDEDDPKEKSEIERIISWIESGAAKPIKIKKRDVVVDAPRLLEVHPIDFIVPSGTMDIHDTERLTHRMFLTERQIRQKGRDLMWRPNVVKAFLKELDAKRKSSRDSMGQRHEFFDEWRQEEALRSGVNTLQQEVTVPVHETHTWMDVDGDGVDERIVVVYSPHDPEKVFKAWEYSDVNNRVPFSAVFFERNVRQYHSGRSLPEKLDDLDRQVTQTHRAKINNMLISTAPTFKYTRTSRANLRGHHWIPGEGIAVDRMDDLDVLHIPERHALIEEREEQVLRTWAEEYIGGTDFGLASQNSLTEPRTATEIRGIQGRARQLISMRGQLFKTGIVEVANNFFDMQHQFGPEEMWVAVTSSEPLRVTREQLQGDFTFQVTATIGEQDPVVEAQKKLARLQVLMQAAQLGLAEPEYELRLGEALLDYLETEDLRAARRIVRRRTEEEIQQIVAERQRQQELEQRVQSGAPASLEELEERMQRVAKESPKGKLQQIK